MRFRVFAAVVGLLFATTASHAQSPQAAADTLMHDDSTSVLVLTSRSVVMTFTDRGIDRLVHRSDSATAAQSSDVWMANLVHRSVDGAFRGLRIAYDLRRISRIEASGATVTITFPPTASSSDNTFTFDSINAESARRFVARVQDRMRAM